MVRSSACCPDWHVDLTPIFNCIHTLMALTSPAHHLPWHPPLCIWINANLYTLPMPKSVLFSMAHICSSLISRICLPSRLIPSTSRISCPIRSPPAWKAAPFGWMEMILGRGCFVLAPPSMAMPKVEEHLGTWIVCRPTRMWDKGGSGRRAGWKKVRLKNETIFWKFEKSVFSGKKNCRLSIINF